ncbi:MAG: phosphotransferase [Sneathiella sp.]
MAAVIEDQKVSEKWGKITPILKALCQFERRRNVSKIDPPYFSIHKTWLASYTFHPRMLASLISFTTPPIPGLFRKHMLGLLASHLSPSKTYGKLSAQATAIQFKPDGNRLRAFYLPSKEFKNGLSLKIVPKKDRILTSTRKEISFRKKLEDLGTIRVPRLYDTEEDDDFLYITEELIQGHRFRHWRHKKLYREQGIPALCNTYKAIGFHKAPLNSYYEPGLVDQLSKIIGKTALEASFLKAVQQAFSENPEIEIGMCHNDLLPSNLGISNNILYFFDWELVGTGPLLPDLLKLPFKYNNSYGLVKAVANQMATEFFAKENTHYHHFAIFIANKLIKAPEKSKKLLNYWRNCHHHFRSKLQ